MMSKIFLLWLREWIGAA